MPREIARIDLYEQVRATPLKQIAPKLGLDALQLSEICKRYGVPTPPAGYWTKLAMGKPVERAPLGPAPGGLGETIVIEPKAKRARKAETVSPSVPANTPPSQVSSSRAPEPVAQPRGLDEPAAEQHRLVEKTVAKLAAAKGDGIVSVSGKGLFTVAATLAQISRMGDLLSQFVRAMEARGWAVKSDDKGFHFMPDGELVRFSIMEQVDKVRHVPTAAEDVALKKHEEARTRAQKLGRYFSDWDRPKIPEWDRIPNGRLVLNLDLGFRSHGVRRKFSDGKSQRLEDLIGDVVESLAAYAANEKAWREERERERQEWAEQDKRRKEAQRRYDLDMKRLEFLNLQLDRLRKLCEVEAFVALLEGQVSQPDIVEEFVAWSRGYAAMLREEISPDRLREKLKRNDLMNEALQVYGWMKLE